MSRAAGIAGRPAGRAADWLAMSLVLLAVAFQFQLTLTVGANPVRVSAADVLSAPLGLILLACAARHGWRRPGWRLPHLWLWLAALTAVMTAALIVGRLDSGKWLSWALFNRYAGWFALLWYFLLGAWLATQSAHVVERFVVPFVLCAAATSAYSAVGFLLQALWALEIPGGVDAFRVVGFMANPNAFGMLLAVAVALQLPLVGTAPGQERRHGVILALLMLGLVLSFSRSAWLGLALALAAFALLRALPVRPVLAAALIALCVAGTLVYGLPVVSRGVDAAGGARAGVFAANLQQNIAERSTGLDDYGSLSRLEMATRAVRMWREQPFLGVGLGSFLHAEVEAAAESPSIIHNTGLWLLTETGLVGALAFAGFFVACLFALAGDRDRRGGPDRALRLGALGALAVFAGVSVGTEAMYQRYLWFIVGAALALPPAPLPAGGERPGAAA